MTDRIRISSGTKWEDYVGYSRALRIGNIVEVSGTVAVDETGHIVGKNNPYEQTRFVLTKIKNALEEAGAALEDVIRTRIYVSDIKNWEPIGRAHGEFFNKIKPASTLFEVSTLIGIDYLVEIEASAIIDSKKT